MASSRRLPTTPNTSTYDSGGGKDYATLQGWEEATDIDMVTANAGEILEVFKGTHDDNDILDSTGGFTDSTYFRVIKPASGESHLDVSPGVPAVDGSMAAFVYTGGANMLQIAEANSQIHDIVGKITSNNAIVQKVFSPRGANSATVGCFAIDGTNVGVGSVSGWELRGGSFAINCSAINNDGSGFLERTGTSRAYNCIAVGNAVDNFSEAGTFILKNCLADNPGGSDYANAPALTTCGSSDGTGSAGLQNQTYTFVNAAGDDFHYTAGSDGIGDGTDLSGDGTYAFDDDIDEDTRSSWDIGFDEFVAAVGEIVANTINYNGLGIMTFRAGRV